MPDQMRRGHLKAPLQWTVLWLGGTYGMFLVLGQVSLVPDVLKLTLYVSGTIFCFVVGYWMKLRTYTATPLPRVPPETDDQITWVRGCVVASSLYLVAFGLALLIEYGATGPSAVLKAIADPGAAYQAKFDIYEKQQASGDTNLALQTLTLLAVFYTPLVPFSVLYWKHLTPAVRVAALLGVVVYASHFLYIGTMKGLGDLVMFAGAAALVLRTWNWRSSLHRSRRRGLRLDTLPVRLL